MKLLRSLDILSLILLVVGGLNWGLVGLFRFDLVTTIFGGFNILSRIVYILVAAAAVFAIARSVHLIHWLHLHTGQHAPSHA
jgi:hypothetical protein